MVELIAILGIIAVLCWLYTKLPIPAPFNIIAACVVAIVAIWLLLGLAHSGLSFGLPRL